MTAAALRSAPRCEPSASDVALAFSPGLGLSTDPTPSPPPHEPAPAGHLATLAAQALIMEAELTPKPGLVDRRGPGAHHDLTLDLMRLSAHTLHPWFERIAHAASGQQPTLALREHLGALGRRAEEAMLAATGGINTHRGAIWTLGLLVAATAMTAGASPASICNTAARLAQLPDTFSPPQTTHGSLAARRFGTPGARGEAQAGFPHIHALALPALHQARAAGLPEDAAQLHTLLVLMQHVPDTCLLHRGGLPALHAAQQGAHRTLALGGLTTPQGRAALADLEATLLTLWASPGGSADLLAATLFFDTLSPEPLFPGPRVHHP